MKIDAARIKSWVERIERLLEERAAINGDIKDIYTEIKSGDHDAKAIRKLIQRRAQDEGELAEQDALLAAYTDAIAGKIKALEAIERGASTKEAAKAAGISTGAVSALAQKRSVQKSQKLNAPRDAAGNPLQCNNDGVILEPEITPTAETESCGSTEGRADGEIPAEGRLGEVERTTPSLCPAAAGVEPGPQDLIKEVAHDPRLLTTPAPEVASPAPPVFEDTLEIPRFLRRQPEAMT